MQSGQFESKIDEPGVLQCRAQPTGTLQEYQWNTKEQPLLYKISANCMLVGCWTRDFEMHNNFTFGMLYCFLKNRGRFQVFMKSFLNCRTLLSTIS